MASNRCLLCGNTYQANSSFSDWLFGNSVIDPLCSPCKNRCQYVKGSICQDCGRPNQAELCTDCRIWRTKYNFVLTNRALLSYDSFLKDFMHQYKFVGDYRLRSAFSSELKEKFGKQISQSELVIPVPVSRQTMRERGFNQVTGLFTFAEKKMRSDILCVADKAQTSKLGRRDRLNKDNLFFLKSKDCVGREITLLDDVYTTGTMLHQAAACLYEAGAKKISTISLAR
ncbi:ComF family protein [Oenococcus sp.]|uniref:ComF family protein n=1 Tax=Oenococcus sp. TaxID=1979414 RepID=UPI0039EA0887